MPRWKTNVRKGKTHRFFPEVEREKLIQQALKGFKSQQAKRKASLLRERALFLVQGSGFEDAVIRSRSDENVFVNVLGHSKNSVLTAVSFGNVSRRLTYPKRGYKKSGLLSLLKKTPLGSLGTVVVRQKTVVREIEGKREAVPVVEIKSLVVPAKKVAKKKPVAERILIMKKLLERINQVYTQYLENFGEVTVKYVVPVSEKGYANVLQGLGFKISRTGSKWIFLSKVLGEETA